MFYFKLIKYMNIDGYGNYFKLFYNTNLTTIKFIITIGRLHDEL